jgi:hypothetical protein
MLLLHRREGALDVLGRGHPHGEQREAQRTRGVLGLPIVEGRTEHRGIPDKGHAPEARHQLAQELQALAAQLRRAAAEAGHVAAGLPETGHEPGAHGIRGAGHHDGNGRRVLPGRDDREIRAGDDHVDLEGHQLLGEPGHPVGGVSRTP